MSVRPVIRDRVEFAELGSVDGLFAAIFDPSQMIRRTTERPECALVAAVVKCAVDDLHGRICDSTQDIEREAYRENARLFFARLTAGNANGGATWGLAFCADILGTDAARLAAQAHRATATVRGLKRARYAPASPLPGRPMRRRRRRKVAA